MPDPDRELALEHDRRAGVRVGRSIRRPTVWWLVGVTLVACSVCGVLMWGGMELLWRIRW